MCAILDTNQFGKFRQEDDQDMHLVKEWLDKNRGRLVYSSYGGYAVEWEETWGGEQNLSRIMIALRNSNKLLKIEKEDIERSEKNFSNRIKSGKINLKSDDEHILALAEASGAKLLISSDKALHKDFKTIIGGSIYQHKGHKHLLKPDLCP